MNQSHVPCPGAAPVSSAFPLKRHGGTLNPSEKAWPGNFCLHVLETCIKEVGNFSCAANFRDFSKRLDSWGQLASQMERIHRDYIKSKNAQTLCCRDNEKCKRVLESTKLLIELERSGNFPDEFDQDTRTIRLSAKTLSNCSSVECLEEIYLHELGHACQKAIVLSANPGEISSPSQSCTTRAMPKLDTYAKYIGSEKAACVWKKVKEQYHKTKLRDVCPDQWYEEAIASVIFSDFFGSPLHFQRVCGSSADLAHPQLDWMIECMPLNK